MAGDLQLHVCGKPALLQARGQRLQLAVNRFDTLLALRKSRMGREQLMPLFSRLGLQVHISIFGIFQHRVV